MNEKSLCSWQNVGLCYHGLQIVHKFCFFISSKVHFRNKIEWQLNRKRNRICVLTIRLHLQMKLYSSETEKDDCKVIQSSIHSMAG